MRKTIAAVTAGLLLVAGQAAAANDSARVGDRVGARVGASSSEFVGIPVPVVLIGLGVLIATFTVFSSDDPASD